MLTKGSSFGESNRYTLIEHLGSGGFSQVWMARDLQMQGDIVALKIYAPENGLDIDGIRMLQEEYKVVDGIRHANLLNPKHFAVYNNSPYLVMPYCPNGSLRKIVNSASQANDETLVRLLYEVGGALSILHRSRIIHFDVKPDNILIGEHEAYLLTDFGTSRKTRSNLSRTIGRSSFHSISYSPPERYEQNPMELPSGDLFSLGVTAYELAMKDVPWDGQGGSVLVRGAEIPYIAEHFNVHLRDVVYRCMSKDPLSRPSAPDVEKWAKEYLLKGPHPLTSTSLNKSVATIKMGRVNPSTDGGEQTTMPAEREENKTVVKKRITLIPVVAGLLVAGTISITALLKNSSKETIPVVPAPNLRPVDTVTISGRVINRTSNIPIALARLHLQKMSNPDLLIKTAVTDKQGHFTFDSLGAGSYWVVLASLDSLYSCDTTRYPIHSGNQPETEVVFSVTKKLPVPSEQQVSPEKKPSETVPPKKIPDNTLPASKYALLKKIRTYSVEIEQGTYKVYCECTFDKKPDRFEYSRSRNCINLTVANAEMISDKNWTTPTNEFVVSQNVTRLSNHSLLVSFCFEQNPIITYEKSSDILSFSFFVSM